MNSPELLSGLERCGRIPFWGKDWKLRKLKPVEMLEAGVHAGLTELARSDYGEVAGEEVYGFGSNPGGLKMFSYVPANLPPRPALVVVLHGCGQSAAGYDLGAGWSTLAKRYGFALLMPEQQAAAKWVRSDGIGEFLRAGSRAAR